MQIPANDSGFDLFEMVATRRTASAASGNIQVSVADQGNFESFYRNNYDASLPSNQYAVSTLAGPPDTYEIRDSGGTLLQSGDYVAGNKIPFNGLALTLDLPAGSATQNFVLDTPKNDNILNGMSDFISAMRDPTLSESDFQLAVSDATTHMSNARTKIDRGLGELGKDEQPGAGDELQRRTQHPEPAGAGQGVRGGHVRGDRGPLQGGCSHERLPARLQQDKQADPLRLYPLTFIR